MNDDKQLLSFNFWPSFTDLMLSLVLILVLVMFFTATSMSVGSVNLSYVQQKQIQIQNVIAKAYKVKVLPISENQYGISTVGNDKYDLVFTDEPTMQKLTFSDHVLFERNSYYLNNQGKIALRIVGKAIKKHLNNIREIQIQGHADTDRSTKFRSNLRLGALRAIEVYQFLQNEVGIDPAKHLMSATTFGEYKPVQRPDDGRYDAQRLLHDNRTNSLKNRNRRIELRLFYRY